MFLFSLAPLSFGGGGFFFSFSCMDGCMLPPWKVENPLLRGASNLPLSPSLVQTDRAQYIYIYKLKNTSHQKKKPLWTTNDLDPGPWREVRRGGPRERPAGFFDGGAREDKARQDEDKSPGPGPGPGPVYYVVVQLTDRAPPSPASFDLTCQTGKNRV